MGNLLSLEMQISILDNAVKMYEFVIKSWTNMPLDKKQLMYEEKCKLEKKLLELRAES